MQTDPGPRTIVLIGNGTTGAAEAIMRAAAEQGIAVRVVERPSINAATDALERMLPIERQTSGAPIGDLLREQAAPAPNRAQRRAEVKRARRRERNRRNQRQEDPDGT